MTSTANKANQALRTMSPPFLAILIVCGLTHWLFGETALLASMGATSLLLFSESAKPKLRALWGAHLAGALIGICASATIPDLTLAAATAVALIHLLLKTTRSSHPPAGATTLLILLASHAGASPIDLVATLVVNLTGISLFILWHHSTQR